MSEPSPFGARTLKDSFLQMSFAVLQSAFWLKNIFGASKNGRKKVKNLFIMSKLYELVTSIGTKMFFYRVATLMPQFFWVKLNT